MGGGGGMFNSGAAQPFSAVAPTMSATRPTAPQAPSFSFGGYGSPYGGGYGSPYGGGFGSPYGGGFGSPYGSPFGGGYNQLAQATQNYNNYGNAMADYGRNAGNYAGAQRQYRNDVRDYNSRVDAYNAQNQQGPFGGSSNPMGAVLSAVAGNRSPFTPVQRMPYEY